MSITGLPGNIPHQGLKERNPPELHISKVRAPTSTDSGANFDIGDIWIDLLSDDAYILVSKGAGVAVWVIMGGVPGGIQTINTLPPDGAGDFTIAAGTNIIITAGVNTITISAVGAVASSFPVDDGGPGIPLANAMSILGRTSVDFPNSSGLETHVGATTNEIYLEDRRFLSSLVVDPSSVVGLRGEFTTITAALAAAVSGQTIYIRPGIYTEDITLIAGVSLIGATVAGASGSVTIAGSVTAEYTGEAEMKGINIAPAAGDAIISTAGAPELVLFESAANPGAGTVCSSANGSLSVVFAISNLASPAGTDLFATTAGNYALLNSFTSNGGTDRILAGGTSSFNILGGRLEHPIETTGTGDVFLTGSIIDSGTLETFNINSAGSQIRTAHIISASSAASGNFVIGTGTFAYADVVSLGSSSGIAGTVTQSIPDWKPYGTATGIVGVNSYNPLHFTTNNTTGEVSLIGGGVAADQFTVDAFTGPGVNPVVPDGAGNVNVNGTIVAAQSIPIRSHTTALNQYAIEVQRSSATAVATGTSNGMSHFDSSQFTVSAAGFVQSLGASVFAWVDSAGGAMTVDTGTFATAAAVYTLPAGTANGETIEIVDVVGGGVILTASGADVIQLQAAASSAGGTATSTALGDALRLKFRLADTTWYAVPGIGGNWTLA